MLLFFLSTIVDRVVGGILKRTGYFKALPPDKTLVFQTSEFNTIATISAQGIRNDLVVTPKPAGVYRILALGDSFTFGWGVDLSDSWPKQLEKQLKNLGENTMPDGRQVEIINAGAPGIELTRMFAICSAYKDLLDIDAIVVAIYTDDILQAGDFAQSQTLWDQVTSRLWPTFLRIREPIVEVSYRDVKNNASVDVSRVWESMAKRILKRDQTTLLTLSPRLRDDFIEGRLNPQFIDLAHQTPKFYLYLLSKKFFQVALRAIDDGLGGIRSCGKNLPVIVVSLPATGLVSERYQQALVELGFTMSPELLTLDVDKDLEMLIKRRGFTFVSSTSVFRADGCSDCYFPYDAHLTKAGHGRVAKILFPVVEQLYNKY